VKQFAVGAMDRDKTTGTSSGGANIAKGKGARLRMDEINKRGSFSETWESVEKRIPRDVLTARYANMLSMARGDLLMRIESLVRVKEKYGQDIILLYDKRWACIEAQLRLSIIEPENETPTWLMDLYNQVMGDTDFLKSVPRET